jgi:hypothetical protein
MGNLQQLRREAERLRRRAGAPIPRETLDHLSESALRFLISDAHKSMRAQAAQAREREQIDALLDQI